MMGDELSGATHNYDKKTSARMDSPFLLVLSASQGFQLFLIFVLALGLRLGVAALRSDNMLNFQTGDYDLYRHGAEDFAVNRNFSNSLFLPRPPLFSLMIYALGINDAAVILVNCLLGALIAPLSDVLARQLGLAEKPAALAALVTGADPTGVLFSPFLAPEPLANLLLLAGVVSLLAAVRTSGRHSLLWATAAGLCLLLSSLTRPATYLLWIGLGVWLLVMYRQRWMVIGVFAFINLAGVGAWTVHNGIVFQHATFSSVGPYTMLYYRAAAVEHLATGAEMGMVFTDINRRVEARMGRDTSNVTADTRYHYLSSSPELASAMQGVAFEIFLAHPLVYVATIPVGFARMYGLLPNAEVLSNWTTYPFLLWNGIFLLGTGYGLWLAFRRKQWMLLWCVLLVAGYYTVGTLAVKSAGMDTRERSMLTPFMAAAFVYAVWVVWEKRKIR